MVEFSILVVQSNDVLIFLDGLFEGIRGDWDDENFVVVEGNNDDEIVGILEGNVNDAGLLDGVKDVDIVGSGDSEIENKAVGGVVLTDVNDGLLDGFKDGCLDADIFGLVDGEFELVVFLVGKLVLIYNDDGFIDGGLDADILDLVEGEFEKELVIFLVGKVVVWVGDVDGGLLNGFKDDDLVDRVDDEGLFVLLG